MTVWYMKLSATPPLGLWLTAWGMFADAHCLKNSKPIRGLPSWMTKSQTLHQRQRKKGKEEAGRCDKGAPSHNANTKLLGQDKDNGATEITHMVRGDTHEGGPQNTRLCPLLKAKFRHLPS